MKKIAIASQQELDNLKRIEADQDVTVDFAGEIFINRRLEVYGTLRINAKIICRDWINGWESSTLNINGWESSTLNIDGRESSAIRLKRITCNLAVSIAAFCCAWKPRDLNVAIQKKTNTAVIIEYYDLPYLERNGVDVKDNKVILYKKVSKEWKTQENTCNETVWTPGTSIIHPTWHPANQECGPGKFHACHHPVFCDEFRNYAGDRYVAISIPVADLYEWVNPTYPHKIAFRTCEVLYECDRKGNPLK